MATMADVKNKVLEKMMAMDLESMSFEEVEKYVFTLRTLSDVNDKGYMEMLLDTFKTTGFTKPAGIVTDCCASEIGGE